MVSCNCVSKSFPAVPLLEKQAIKPIQLESADEADGLRRVRSGLLRSRDHFRPKCPSDRNTEWLCMSMEVLDFAAWGCQSAAACGELVGSAVHAV